MHLLLAGMFGLGGPELVLLPLLAIAAMGVVVDPADCCPTAHRSGYRTRCGHALQQPPDSRFCASCATPVR